MAERKKMRVSEDLIDANLKQIFQADVEQELPDRLTDLIEKLRSGGAVAPDSSKEVKK